MSAALSPFSAPDLGLLSRLVTDPSLADEFDLLQGDGAVERKLADPFIDRTATRIASAGGKPVGFCVVFKLNGREGAWCMVRIGVLAEHRRRRIGTQLLEDALAGIRARHPDVNEALIGAWVPSEAAAGFAAHHGLKHARNFWLMARPIGPVPAMPWPAGVEVRTFDGTDAALADWNDIYNRSFADHWHSAVATVEDARQFVADPKFRADGLFLAYRDGRCVGFTRNILRDHEGEVGLIGTAPEARGIGLGRALLRQAVGWIQAQGVPRVVLRVDGENEGALGLYRSEGFETIRTRSMWSRPMP